MAAIEKCEEAAQCNWKSCGNAYCLDHQKTVKVRGKHSTREYNMCTECYVTWAKEAKKRSYIVLAIILIIFCCGVPLALLGSFSDSSASSSYYSSSSGSYSYSSSYSNYYYY